MRSLTVSLVIFGARGFIGGYIARALRSATGFAVRGYSSADVDLTNANQTAAVASSLPSAPTLLFAAAAQPDRDIPSMGVMIANMSMAPNMAELVRATRPAHVTYLSSIDVYGRYDLALPLSEASTIRPDSPYAISKFATERLLAVACGEARIPLAVLRLPGVYGQGDTHHGPIRTFLDAARAGAPIRIYGDGRQRRDLLFIDDLSRIVETVCRQRIEGVFNAVTGRSHSLNEMAGIVSRIVGRPVEIVHQATDARQADLSFAESGLLRVMPEFVFTPLEEGLRRTWNVSAST
ncbi:MAG TPA: NAD(P)-dependent oxidoreductase [Candidatus Hydrogenedentes bacterium]|nr:NAD(P)-dependent oxidoreductase [Candidatus Hydrogenedentota bacterium]HPG65597.1 NAD(P)-dependent oxidoreductase [Candidatus Hydrogenedentota bacterium]